MLPRLLSRLAQWSLREGEVTFPNDKLSTQIAVLDTLKEEPLIGGLGDYIVEFPLFLNLRARILPEYVTPMTQSLKAVYVLNGKTHRPCYPFTGKELQNIHVLYDDCGQDDRGQNFRGIEIQKGMTLDLKEGLLYAHRFPIPAEQQLIVSKNLKGQGKWQYTIQGRPLAYRSQEALFPGGGYYQSGCALEDIAARVFNISTLNGEQTHISLENLPEHLNKEYPSLGVALRLGESHIKVLDACGGEQIYQSIGFKQENLALNQVDIIYAQKIS